MAEFFQYLTMPYLLQGMLVSIEITAITMVLALILGLGLALMRNRGTCPSGLSPAPMSWFVRGTPILLQLVFIYTALPSLGIMLDSISTAILGFTLNEAAFAGEIIRGGIRSVSRTQVLAAQSLGMNAFLTLRKIILPQALRAILPALGNDTISMLKFTSLASVIAVNELMLRSQSIVSQNYLFFQVFSAAGVMYLAVTTLLGFGQNFIEAKLRIGSHETADVDSVSFASRLFGFRKQRREAAGSTEPSAFVEQSTMSPDPACGPARQPSAGLSQFLGQLATADRTASDEIHVDCRNVTKNYGSRQILAGVDFQVKRGEVVVLIGPSGSGKSTLLRMINHIETLDNGEILVSGKHVGYNRVNGMLRPVRNLAAARARARIGMVFQHFNLFDHLSVEENVTIAPVRVFGEAPEAARKTAIALLNDVGLGNHLEHLPHRLSGGQQQRVAIVRALAISPHLMLFDEPTSALDPELVEDVLQLMRRLADAGMTMIVVTHEMRFARAVADRIVFMADGRVVEQGAPEDILTNPREERTRRFLAIWCTENSTHQRSRSAGGPGERRIQTTWNVMRIAIIGAGFGGIAAAVKLKEVGLSDFVIYEKSAGIGGTWWDNRYPGAATDAASHIYSYSFARHDWAARMWGIATCATISTRWLTASTCGATFASTQCGLPHLGWQPQWLRTEDGRWRGRIFDCVISAVGMFAKPRYPQWPGLDTFRGPVIHTAGWDETVQLEGKRVAVVGTGVERRANCAGSRR